MKKNRVIIFTIMFLALTFGLYTGDKIYFIVFSVLLIMVLYALAMVIWIIIDFKYLQTIEPTILHKEESATLKIEIHNDTPFIYPYMMVYFITPLDSIEKSEKEKMLSVLPFDLEIIQEKCTCHIRGKYPVGITRIKVRDIFGIFKFNIVLSKKSYFKQLYITVYPRVLDIPHLPIPLAQIEGTTRNRLISTQEPSSVSDIREYEYGDPLKKIHWNISSKYQDIYVKNYEISVEQQILIFLDTTPYPIDGICKYEVEDQMIECTVSIINHLLNRAIPIELIMYNGDRLELGGENLHDFPYIYNFLAPLSFEGRFSIEQILTMEQSNMDMNSNTILITHNINSELFNRMCILKQVGIYPMLFLIEDFKHKDYDMDDIIKQLNEKGIPSYKVPTHRRFDEVLEDILR